eukprot:SAG31_NODE_38137_length_298_cov_1.557789_1_plen_82_part_01
MVMCSLPEVGVGVSASGSPAGTPLQSPLRPTLNRPFHGTNSTSELQALDEANARLRRLLSDDSWEPLLTVEGGVIGPARGHL